MSFFQEGLKVIHGKEYDVIHSKTIVLELHGLLACGHILAVCPSASQRA
jgi:hypothetical protein